MSVLRASLLIVVVLIILAPSTALTIPSALSRLVNSLAPAAISEEPDRPQWPAQYQVGLLFAPICGLEALHSLLKAMPKP